MSRQSSETFRSAQIRSFSTTFRTRAFENRSRTREKGVDKDHLFRFPKNPVAALLDNDDPSLHPGDHSPDFWVSWK
jgi:hypothetical protein